MLTAEDLHGVGVPAGEERFTRTYNFADLEALQAAAEQQATT
jgi:hypothetical protein